MSAAKKRAASTTAAGKATATKAPAKKTAAQKAPAAKKAAAKKSAAKKTAATRTSGTNRPTAKKAAPKKTAAKKTGQAKATGATNKSVAKKSATKKTAPSKSTTKKAATNKAAATRTAPPATPRSMSTTQTPDTTSRKTAVNNNSTTATAEKPARLAAKDIKKLPVRPGEDPWTKAELDEVRAELEADIVRQQAQIEATEAELAGLLRDGSDGAGRDPADVGSSNFERDQEMSLAQNAREMLDQTQLALRNIGTGTFGTCENCGEPIGKGRLMVFPRATLCVTCKQRQERR